MTASNNSRLRNITGIVATPPRLMDTSLANITSEWDEKNLSRSERQLDLNVAASGSGSGYYCPEGIPVETALFALLAASALAFGILFRAITLITGGRKKREAHEYDYGFRESSIHFPIGISNFLWQGMTIKILKNRIFLLA